MNLWKKKTTRIPTDLEILDAIYERYKDAYVGGVEGKDRPVNYVSVDIPMIAEALGAEPNGIFGRLYYHLQPKYGYQKMVDDRMVSVHFFDIEIGGKRHCIHFPLMMSVLAGLRKEHSFFPDCHVDFYHRARGVYSFISVGACRGLSGRPRHE